MGGANLLRLIAGSLLCALLLPAPAQSAVPRECREPDDDRCEAWVQAWDGKTNETNKGAYPEEATDSIVSPDGETLYVTGNSYEDNGEGSDIVVMAIDTDSGRRLWVTRYEGKKDGREFNSAAGIALSPSGDRIYVTGRRNSTFRGKSELTLLRLDPATGNLKWVVTGRANNSAGGDLVVSPDGQFVYVVGSGRASNEDNERDVVLVTFGANLGRRMGRTTYDGYGAKDSGGRVEISPDGRRLFVLANAQRRGGSDDVFVLAYNVGERRKDPMLAWDRVTHAGGWAFNEQLDIAPEGDAIFVSAQQTFPDDGAWAYKTVGVATGSGAILWDEREEGQTGNVLLVDPDGSSIYVGGVTAYEGDEQHPRVVARDTETGALLWEAVDEDIDYTTEFNDIALDPQRDVVYMAGGALDQTADLFTVGFSTNDGRALWSARFNHTESGYGEIRANTISVGPDGFVYSAGEGYGTDDEPKTGSGYNKSDLYVVSYAPE